MWTIVDDYHKDGAIEVFEYKGVPVLVSFAGRYPQATNGAVTTRDCAHLEIWICSMSKGDEITYTDIGIIAWSGRDQGARRNALTVWRKKDLAEPDYKNMLAEAKTHLDEALDVLSNVDNIFQQAEDRMQPMYSYGQFDDRPSYESACKEMQVKPLDDNEILSSYGVRFGDFGFPDYEVDHCIQMHLSRLRQRALDKAHEEELKKKPKEPEKPITKSGQLWEPCENCGKEPVYMPLHLCDGCWPKQ